MSRNTWMNPRVLAVYMTKEEFGRRCFRRRPLAPHHLLEKGKTYKPVEKGANSAFGIGNRIRIVRIERTKKSIFYHFVFEKRENDHPQPLKQAVVGEADSGFYKH